MAHEIRTTGTASATPSVTPNPSTSWHVWHVIDVGDVSRIVAAIGGSDMVACLPLSGVP